MNKQQLQQEIESLQKKLEEKQKALAAIPDKWEPKGWGYLDRAGLQCECAIRQRAEKTTKAMRSYNRLLAYVAEFAPDWEPNWKDGLEEKAYLSKSNADFGEWTVFVHNIYKAAGVVYMPVDVAIDLCRKLNSGEVEL